MPQTRRRKKPGSRRKEGESDEEIQNLTDQDNPLDDDIPDELQNPDGLLPEEAEQLYLEGDDRPPSCAYCEGNGCDRCGQDQDEALTARPPELRKVRREPPVKTVTDEDRAELRRQYALAEAAPMPRGSESKLSHR